MSGGLRLAGHQARSWGPPTSHPGRLGSVCPWPVQRDCLRRGSKVPDGPAVRGQNAGRRRVGCDSGKLCPDSGRSPGRDPRDWPEPQRSPWPLELPGPAAETQTRQASPVGAGPVDAWPRPPHHHLCPVKTAGAGPPPGLSGGGAHLPRGAVRASGPEKRFRNQEVGCGRGRGPGPFAGAALPWPPRRRGPAGLLPPGTAATGVGGPLRRVR